MADPLTLIAKARAEKKLSIRQLSALTGIAQDTITGIERRRTRPRLNTLAILANALDLDLDEVWADQTGGET